MACIFCRIAAGEIPSELLHQDDEIIAFRDINPKAPVHILVVPRKRIASLTELTAEEMPILGKMASAAKKLAERESISETGYRIVVKCGPEGGQVVPHLHMHLLGGRQLSAKMG